MNNIRTLTDIATKSIIDFDASDIAYLTAKYGYMALSTNTSNNRSLLSQLSDSQIKLIDPYCFYSGETVKNMTISQRQAMTWEQLTYRVLVKEGTGRNTSYNLKSVLWTLTSINDLSPGNLAMLDHTTIPHLSGVFLATATHAWLTDRSKDANNTDQKRLKFLTQAQWAQARNIDFSLITPTDLSALLPNVPLSNWTVTMLQKTTAIGADNITKKVFQVLNANQMAGLAKELAKLTSSEIDLLQASQMTGISTDAWIRSGFLQMLTSADLARLQVPAGVIAQALAAGPINAQGVRTSILTAAQISDLSDTQLTTLINGNSASNAVINRVIRAGQAADLNPGKFTAAVVALISPTEFKNNIFSRSQLVSASGDSNKTFLQLLSPAQVASLYLSKLNQLDIESLSNEQKTALGSRQLKQTTLDNVVVDTFVTMTGALNAFWSDIRSKISAFERDPNTNTTKARKRTDLATSVKALTKGQLLANLAANGAPAVGILGEEFIKELETSQLGDPDVLKKLHMAGMLKFLTSNQLNATLTVNNARTTLYEYINTLRSDTNSKLSNSLSWVNASANQLNTFLFGQNGVPSSYSSSIATSINDLSKLIKADGEPAFLQTVDASIASPSGNTVLAYFYDKIIGSTLSVNDKTTYINQIDLNFYRHFAGAKHKDGSYIISNALLNNVLSYSALNNGLLRQDGARDTNTTVNRTRAYSALLASGRFYDLSLAVLFNHTLANNGHAVFKACVDILFGDPNFGRLFSTAPDALYSMSTEAEWGNIMSSNVSIRGKTFTMGSQVVKAIINSTVVSSVGIQAMGESITPYLNKANLTVAFIDKMSAYQVDSLASGSLTLTFFNSLSDEQKFSSENPNSGRLWWQKLDDGTRIISKLSDAVFASNDNDFIAKLLSAGNTSTLTEMSEFLASTLQSTTPNTSFKVYERLLASDFNNNAWARGASLNKDNINLRNRAGSLYSSLLDGESAQYLNLSGFDDAYVNTFLTTTFDSTVSGESVTKSGLELLHGENLALTTTDGTVIATLLTDTQLNSLSASQLGQADLRVFWREQITVANGNGTSTKYLYECLDPSALSDLINPDMAFANFTSDQLKSLLSDGKTLLSHLSLSKPNTSQWKSDLVATLTATQVGAFTSETLNSKIQDGTHLLQSLTAEAVAGANLESNDNFYGWVARVFLPYQTAKLTYQQLNTLSSSVNGNMGDLQAGDYVALQLLDGAKLNLLSDTTLASLTAADLKKSSYWKGKVIDHLSSANISKLTASVLTDATVAQALTDRQVVSLLSSQLETSFTDAATNTQKYMMELLTPAQQKLLTADQFDGLWNTSRINPDDNSLQDQGNANSLIQKIAANLTSDQKEAMPQWYRDLNRNQYSNVNI